MEKFVVTYLPLKFRVTKADVSLSNGKTLTAENTMEWLNYAGVVPRVQSRLQKRGEKDYDLISIWLKQGKSSRKGDL